MSAISKSKVKNLKMQGVQKKCPESLCFFFFWNSVFHAKPILFCNILILPSCNTDSRRRYNLINLYCCVQGKVGELFQNSRSKWGLPWGLVCWTNGRRKLCMVLCHACHIYGIWGSKEVEGQFRIIIWCGNASHKEGKFLWEMEVLIM